MKELIVLIIFATSSIISFGQCSTVSISVSSSDTTSVQLYHAGFFNIPSGFANICEWEVTTSSGDIVYQDTTSGDAFEQGLVLFDHSVPITDSMYVDVNIKNNIEGITCKLTDTLYWEEIEILPGSFIGNWAILSGTGGMEEELVTSIEFIIDAERILLFPSPVDGYFEIKGPNELYSLSILDLNGQVVEELNNVLMPQRVDFSRFSSGLYFVQFRNKDNINVELKKIIIN